MVKVSGYLGVQEIGYKELGSKYSYIIGVEFARLESTPPTNTGAAMGSGGDNPGATISLEKFTCCSVSKNLF